MKYEDFYNIAEYGNTARRRWRPQKSIGTLWPECQIY